jgi:hypothetical protein
VWKTYTKEPAFEELRTFLKDYLEKKGGKIAKKMAKLKKKKKLDDTLWFKGVSNLGDFGLADMRLRLDWFFKDIDHPEDLSKSMWEKIRLVNFGKHMSQFYDLYMVRTIVSPFLIHLREEFTKKIASITKYEAELKAGKKDAREDYRIKLRSYMTHDTFLSPTMLILGLIDPECVYQETTQLVNKGCTSKPPVAAAIVWELNQKTVNG